MDLAQLIGRLLRLQRELYAAGSKPPQQRLADRLAGDLESTRDEVAKVRGADEQTGDSMPFLSSKLFFVSSQFKDQ